MLPGISAEDCLFADIGIDPSYPGLQTLEATDLLLRNRQLLTDVHVIIWQVGCVGDVGFRRKGYINQNFHHLISRLQSIYGDDYEIIHYVAAQYPVSQPLIEKIPLSQFLEPETAKKVSGISTFYVPPKEDRQIDVKMAVELGLSKSIEDAKKIPSMKDRKIDQYSPREMKALNALADWTVPVPYTHTPPSNMASYIGKLSYDTAALTAHKKDPKKHMETHELSSTEQAHVSSGHAGRIRMAMKTDAPTVADQVAIRLVTDPDFASAYADECRKLKGDPDFDTKFNSWLVIRGYDTTVEDVEAAMKNLQQTSLLMWSGTYNTTKEGVTIVIVGQEPPEAGVVYVSNVQIQNHSFTNQTLTWSTKDGNTSNASLVFTSNDDTGDLSFAGKYWTSSEKMPTADNIKGQTKNYQSSLSDWVGRYKTYQDANPGPEVYIGLAGDSTETTVTVGGKEIMNYNYDGSTKQLSWKESDNGTNVFLPSTQPRQQIHQ